MRVGYNNPDVRGWHVHALESPTFRCRRLCRTRRFLSSERESNLMRTIVDEMEVVVHWVRDVGYKQGL